MNYDLESHQNNAYEALLELDEILNRNNIEYFLLAGSTLGAVRHKGFIPWDDDIDVGIFIKDKDVVSLLLEKELSEKFKWIDRRCDPKFPRLYGKILCGSYGCVDVFLLVKTSNSICGRKFQWTLRKVLFKCYNAKHHYISEYERRARFGMVKVCAARIVSAFLPMKLIERLIKKNELRYEKLLNNDNYLNLYSCYSLNKELIRSDWLNNKSYVNFRTGKFPTVGDPDAYLAHLYGDYMKLPPEDKRHPHHIETY